MGGRPEGLVRVLAEHHDPAAPPPGAAAEQLALLAPAEAEAEQVERRGPGRRPGSLNRRTEQWTRYIQAAYGSPLEALARVMAGGPDRLAAELGCDRLDAWDRWLRVCEAILPYLHQKQPVALNLDQAPAAPVVIGVSAEAIERSGASAADAEAVVQIVLDQALGEAPASGVGSEEVGR